MIKPKPIAIITNSISIGKRSCMISFPQKDEDKIIQMLRKGGFDVEKREMDL